MAQRTGLALLLLGALALALFAAVGSTARAADKATDRDYGVTDETRRDHDPVRTGAFVFKQRCSVCHSLNAGGKTDYGPYLEGLLGRKAAATDWPEYTKALKDSDVVWDAETLDKLLTEPQELVPGVKMDVIIRFRRSRQALVAYLKTL